MYVALDYLGPLMVKDSDSLTKNWVCLYTCLNVRAIQLEVVENMTAECFILCFRRFIARRGTPKMIISDNGTQLKLGGSVIGKLWGKIIADEDIQSYASNEGIEWKYITEYSPWKGGFYERLVGMVKRSLRKTLGKSKVSGQQLTTIITEIEAITNSRSLIYLTDDINSTQTLTPAHFLSISSQTGTPEIMEEYCPRETTSTTLMNKWKKGQMYLNRFWKLWITEYLQGLREWQNLHTRAVKGEVPRCPNVGEVVIVKDEGRPCGHWKIARIIKLIVNELDEILN